MTVQSAAWTLAVMSTIHCSNVGFYCSSSDRLLQASQTHSWTLDVGVNDIISHQLPIGQHTWGKALGDCWRVGGKRQVTDRLLQAIRSSCLLRQNVQCHPSNTLPGGA